MVAPPQHVALTRVTSTPLPSLRCVAPAGSAEGEQSAPPELRAPTQGLLLHFRFNSTLPQSLQHRKHRRPPKYARLPLTAAAAVAAGALGVTGVSAGTMPWTEATGNVAGTAHTVSRAPAGQAGSPVVDSVIGTKSNAAAATLWRPLSQTGDLQLDSREVSAADAIMVPAADAIMVPAALSASAAAGNSAQHRAHAQPAAASAAGAWVQIAHTDAERQRAAHAAAARSAAAQARQAKAQAARSQQARAQAAPYLIYDSVSPSAIPASQQRVATYVNGAYAAQATEVSGRGSVLWIDTNGSDPAASALDVEPGDATPAGAAQWVDQKLTADPHSLAIVYTMLADWQQVKDDVAGLPAWMQSRVRYWIADPTGVPHMVPGSNATQWYWGNSYDITTANPDFQAS
jgi:hypothetical protein